MDPPEETSNVDITPNLDALKVFLDKKERGPADTAIPTAKRVIRLKKKLAEKQ